MLKTVSAILAAALLAGGLTLLPSFSPQVEASAGGPAVKGDRLDLGRFGRECAQHAWPYYEAHCLRVRPGEAARSVRLVAPDRVSR